MKNVWLLLLAALAGGMCSLPAVAGTALFSDLAPDGSYNTGGGGWGVQGSGNPIPGNTTAALFTVSGSGSEAISEIDIGIGNLSVPDTFYASIWTDSSGAPGTQLAGAYWSLFAPAPAFLGGSLVSITGISGLSLTGGASFFLVLGPLNIADTSINIWQFNNQGDFGDTQHSGDGGATWIDNGPGSPLGAFDILSSTNAPEPGSLFLLGTGLIGVVGVLHLRSRRTRSGHAGARERSR